MSVYDKIIEATQAQTAQSGCLYIISTPIGNLGDISFRAVQLLQTCDIIACEDTRVTSRLLSFLSIQGKQLLSYRDENELKESINLADYLESGKSIALVCDAGTPTLSDPGFRLVRECRRRNITVVPVPGSSALLAGLSASGLPTNQFYYVGFLPSKKAARIKFFNQHIDFPSTLVLYESCHRIDKFASDLLETMGEERVVCFGRELTKLHESFLIGPIKNVKDSLVGRHLKGEFVIIIAPKDFKI